MQPDSQQFEIALRSAGLKATKSRRALYTELANASEPMSTHDLIAKLGSMHYVTVYRTLDTLAQVGIIKRVPIGLKYKYELNDDFKPHHHHVTCEICGRSVPVTDQAIEQLMEQITRGAGLRPTRHYFEAYGTCLEH